MKIVISPAKKISDKKLTQSNYSNNKFSSETNYLINKLQNYKLYEIKKLMAISDDLAQLNFDRYQQWNTNSRVLNSAIYLFDGDVYKGIRVEDFTDNDINFAQDNLRILSGLYGLLKPLDLISAYRLEMGAKMKTNQGNNLYDFWGDKLSKMLLSEMKTSEVLLNLASNEYSSVLNLDTFFNSVITPVFKDYKNGKLKIVSFYAKRARGEMCNFIIKNKISKIEELKNFSNLGYKFSEQDDVGNLLFTR